MVKLKKIPPDRAKKGSVTYISLGVISHLGALALGKQVQMTRKNEQRQNKKSVKQYRNVTINCEQHFVTI